MPKAKPFWSNVNKLGPSVNPELGPCWVWTAGKSGDGYGAVFANGRTIGAHRRSWMLAGGAIPDGMMVLHHCDNPLCVRPGHLYVGTHSDNTIDAVLRGRMASGDRNASRLTPDLLARGDEHWTRRNPERLARGDQNGSRVHRERLPRGERHWKSKLTEDDVRAIRAQREAGLKIKDIGDRFGVTDRLVSAIVLRQIWKHVV